MGLFALPGIFLSIPGGILFDRFGTKKIAVFCFLLMIAGTIIVIFGRTFLHLALGRVVSGVGALVLAIGLPQIVAQWFNGKELGTAMGIFNTALPLGTIISFTMLGSLGKNLGWQASVSISVIISLVALITFILFYKSAPLITDKTFRRQSIGLLNIREAGVSIWLVGFAWMWFNASTISFITFAPDFFMTNKGLSIEFSGFLASFLVWGSFILSPVVGYITDKIGIKEILIALGSLSMAVFIFLIPYGNTFIIFLMAMIGISAGLIPTPVFSLPPDIMEPKNLGLGFGILSTCLSIGMVLGPYLVGLIRDWTGSYNTSFGVMAGFALCVTVTILRLPSSSHLKR